MTQASVTDSVSRLADVLRGLPAPYGPRALPPPVPADTVLEDVAVGYAEFLRLADGDVLQNPVCVERGTGEVWWFGDLDIVWHTDPELATSTRVGDDFAAFLDDLILGPGYREHLATGPDDPWLAALDTAQQQPSQGDQR